MWKSVVFHTLAVVISLGVAYALIQLLGVDSPIVASVIALVVVALEKLVRANNSIPIKDWVNK